MKHLLRDWIESKLANLKQGDDPTALGGPLNDQLHKAGLIGRWPDDPADALGISPGFVKEIAIRHDTSLVITTGLSIENCGFDESAYIYDLTADHWRRVWVDEQSDYAEKKYLPQGYRGVYISPPNYAQGADRSERLVLTLGRHDWCTSSWQDVYYRVWRIKSSYPTPKLLIDGPVEWAFGAREPEIKGSVGFNDVLIEYTIAGGFHSREEVRHYRVGPDDKVTRIDPLALRPTDFVEEWGLRSWATSSTWTQPSSRQKLAAAYERLKSRSGERDYGPTTHCSDRPDLWQVNLTSGFETAGTSMYFLVRWRPPYRFTMVDASDHRWPACDELDPRADELRTLFPSQDWR